MHWLLSTDFISVRYQWKRPTRLASYRYFCPSWASMVVWASARNASSAAFALRIGSWYITSSRFWQQTKEVETVQKRLSCSLRMGFERKMTTAIRGNPSNSPLKPLDTKFQPHRMLPPSTDHESHACNAVEGTSLHDTTIARSAKRSEIATLADRFRADKWGGPVIQSNLQHFVTENATAADGHKSSISVHCN